MHDLSYTETISKNNTLNNERTDDLTFNSVKPYYE
jgi:hypothetical protein